MKWLKKIFSKSEKQSVPVQKDNPLILKLGGYNVNYTKEQKIAIFLSVMAAYTLNEGNKLSLEENFIMESISEYLESTKLGSDNSITEFLSKGQDHIVTTLKDLSDEQKDFYIVILST
ncbi:MAG: hypothetical protein AB9834_02620 [Lentimicrobium sp.]